MKETKDMNSQNKENTIDILVSPKKKQEEAPKAAAPKAAPAAPKKPSPKTAPKKRKDLRDGASIPVKDSFRKAMDKVSSETRKIAGNLDAVGKKIATSAAKKSEKQPLPVKKAKTKTPPAKMTPAEKKAAVASLGSTVVIALIYIGIVVAVSAILSTCGIRWANDIFALVKDDVTATVTIPENATVSEVSTILKENDLIEYPGIFRFYINFKNRDADPPLAFKAGEYEISAKLNYDQIVSMIKDRKKRSIVTITIPEGYTVDQIIELFTSQGMGTREGFVDAINNFDYTYTFMEKLGQIELSDQRKYRLEGYLFPDTYEFYTDSGEIAIVDKLLAAFEAHFENGYYDRLTELGMNLDQVVTLASIVQKEGKFNSDFYPIAGVFYNRLNSKNMKRLQSDATVQYCLSEHKEELTYDDLEVESPYNTYRNAGLPPSAISNPGWEAIQAALYPENHTHYFFIADTDGSTIFADTEPQHQANAAKLRAAKENGTSID